MIDLVQPVFQLALFVFGFLTGKAFTMWEVNRISAIGPDGEPVKLRGFPVILTILIVSFLMLTGFGFQQSRYQEQAREYDTCVQDWGNDLVDTVTTRSVVAGAVSDARTRRDDAIDRVLLVVAAYSGAPEGSEERARGVRQFRKALSEFAAAKHAYDAAQKLQDTAQKRNPYPELDCR